MDGVNLGRTYNDALHWRKPVSDAIVPDIFSLCVALVPPFNVMQILCIYVTRAIRIVVIDEFMWRFVCDRRIMSKFKGHGRNDQI